VTVRALLLDFDGTLADSLSAMRRVYGRFVTQLGGTPSDDEFDALNGPPLRDVVESLCRTHGGRAHEPRDRQSYERLIDEELRNVTPNLGIERLLDAAAERSIRCGIVTSGNANLVEAWLDARELGDRCALLVSSDDVANGKPSPEPYLAALEKLGVSPADAVAIEDSPAGVASATAAGIPTLHLTAGAKCGPAVARISGLVDAVPYLDGLTR
jgi:HAD superfamily hydrolase (TIGR01509 family)